MSGSKPAPVLPMLESPDPPPEPPSRGAGHLLGRCRDGRRPRLRHSRHTSALGGRVHRGGHAPAARPARQPRLATRRVLGHPGPGQPRAQRRRASRARAAGHGAHPDSRVPAHRRALAQGRSGQDHDRSHARAHVREPPRRPRGRPRRQPRCGQPGPPDAAGDHQHGHRPAAGAPVHRAVCRHAQLHVPGRRVPARGRGLRRRPPDQPGPGRGGLPRGHRHPRPALQPRPRRHRHRHPRQRDPGRAGRGRPDRRGHAAGARRCARGRHDPGLARGARPRRPRARCGRRRQRRARAGPARARPDRRSLRRTVLCRGAHPLGRDPAGRSPHHPRRPATRDPRRLRRARRRGRPDLRHPSATPARRARASTARARPTGLVRDEPPRAASARPPRQHRRPRRAAARRAAARTGLRCTLEGVLQRPEGHRAEEEARDQEVRLGPGVPPHRGRPGQRHERRRRLCLV